MNRYLASDWAIVRRILGTRAGSVYGAGLALLVLYLLVSVAVGPASFGGPSVGASLLWLAFPVACLLVVGGGWALRRNWLAWSIKRNLLVELLVLAPVVAWWTLVGQPASFSYAANPVITVLVMLWGGLAVTLLLSAVVLAVRVVVGFVRGHPDPDPPAADGDADAAEPTDAAEDDGAS